MSQEASQQAANSAEVGQLRAQLSHAEAAAASAEQQAASAVAQLAEAQQALIDADRRVDKNGITLSLGVPTTHSLCTPCLAT